MNEHTNHPDQPPVRRYPPVTPDAPFDEEAQSKKILCGVLALLFGWLAIHKFVLGYTSAGLISILVGVLTCGVGALVMHVIAIAEGIIYLTKTSSEFRATYMDGKKEWF